MTLYPATLATIALAALLPIAHAQEKREKAAPPKAPEETYKEMQIIGDPGNRPDGNGFGSVPYVFEIDHSRVNNREYAIFLNTVDPKGRNQLSLYNPSMATHRDGGITLNRDKPEGERYQVRQGHAEIPVRFIDWFCAARYVNWIANGGTAKSDTEKGSYHLDTAPGQIVPRRRGARFWIPNENEWYKAAAFHTDGPDDESYYRLNPEWRRSMLGNTVMEIVDIPQEEEAIQPVANGRPAIPGVRFLFASATTENDRQRNWGFRLARMTLEEVAEGPWGGVPTYTTPNFSPFGFGGAPFPIPTTTTTDLDPAS